MLTWGFYFCWSLLVCANTVELTKQQSSEHGSLPPGASEGTSSNRNSLKTVNPEVSVLFLSLATFLSFPCVSCFIFSDAYLNGFSAFLLAIRRPLWSPSDFEPRWQGYCSVLEQPELASLLCLGLLYWSTSVKWNTSHLCCLVDFTLRRFQNVIPAFCGASGSAYVDVILPHRPELVALVWVHMFTNVTVLAATAFQISVFANCTNSRMCLSTQRNVSRWKFWWLMGLCLTYLLQPQPTVNLAFLLLKTFSLLYVQEHGQSSSWEWGSMLKCS